MEKSVPEMIQSLKEMGVDTSQFTKEQLEKVQAIADKVADPTKVDESVFKEVASVLHQSKRTKPIVGKVPVNSPCPCGSGKKYKKCCRK